MGGAGARRGALILSALLLGGCASDEATDARRGGTDVETTGAAEGAPAAASALPDDPLAPHASPWAGVEYVGSARCAPCHPAVSEEWVASSHATTVRTATLDDEDRLNDMIQCSGMGFTHVLGDRHHVRWLREVDETPWGEGRWLVLPCGWDVHEKEVTYHHLRDWKANAWESGCAACHVTGFRADDHGFLELGVGCEECHGPGGRHVNTANPADVYTFNGRTAAEEVTVCASCHLQGGSSLSTGMKLPPHYVPGGSLFDDYRFDWAELDAEAREKALDAHQKILVRRVVFDGDASLRCTSCHSLHDLGHEKHSRQPKSDYCQTCHEPDMTLKEYSQSCNICEF